MLVRYTCVRLQFQSWFPIGEEVLKSAFVRRTPTDLEVNWVGLGWAYIFTLISQYVARMDMEGSETGREEF
jgi:hypothetical protein